MLLAYIDEIGEPGAFVAADHSRFNTSPAFGYAGFVLPAERARSFGASFHHQKRALFGPEMAEAEHPGRWERKGSDLFRPDTPDRFPQHLRVFDALIRTLRQHDGHLFFYADEKPLGTPGQTRLDVVSRERSAMQQALNRLARHAERSDHHLLVMIDQINEKTRRERLAQMYAHILSRAAGFPEMERIIEPPMHVDSQLSSNVQFADWVAACVTRAIDYQLIKQTRYSWIADQHRVRAVRGAFTAESKLALWQRSLEDFHHSTVFDRRRRLFPAARGASLQDRVDPAILRKIKAATERQGRAR